MKVSIIIPFKNLDKMVEECVGKCLELDYKNYVAVDDKYKRPAEVPALLGNASKAKKILGWNPQVKFKDLVYMMVESDLKEQFEERGIVAVDPENKNKKGFYIQKARELLEKRAKDIKI